MRGGLLGKAPLTAK